MALAAREHLALTDNLNNLWRKPRLGIVRYADYYKLHSSLIPFRAFHRRSRRCQFFTLKIPSWFQLCSIVKRQDGVTERCGQIATTLASLDDNLWNILERLYHVL